MIGELLTFVIGNAPETVKMLGIDSEPMTPLIVKPPLPPLVGVITMPGPAVSPVIVVVLVAAAAAADVTCVVTDDGTFEYGNAELRSLIRNWRELALRSLDSTSSAGNTPRCGKPGAKSSGGAPGASGAAAPGPTPVPVCPPALIRAAFAAIA